jgi:hypothetical protein
MLTFGLRPVEVAVTITQLPEPLDPKAASGADIVPDSGLLAG